jgi:DNA-directed RNA polymerase subunit RPC12/RpoP
MKKKNEYNCFVCLKIFGKSRSLEEHMSDAHKGITMPVHEEKKLYECNICNKRFGRRRYDMIKHIETVHEAKKPYECIICNNRFGGRYYMQKHIETVHEAKKKHEVMKKYNCFDCQKTFKTNKKLKGHMSFAHKEKMAVHEKKKKYGCITCNKSFGKKIEMKKHIESFHNTIPFGVNNISKKAQDILRESLKFDSAIETHSMKIAQTPEKKEKSAKIEVKLLKKESSDDKIENNGEKVVTDMKNHKCSKNIAFVHHELLQYVFSSLLRNQN